MRAKRLLYQFQSDNSRKSSPKDIIKARTSYSSTNQASQLVLISIENGKDFKPTEKRSSTTPSITSNNESKRTKKRMKTSKKSEERCEGERSRPRSKLLASQRYVKLCLPLRTIKTCKVINNDPLQFILSMTTC